MVASRHHLGESTSVLLALFGMELAAIWKQRTGRSQDVKVNVRNAVCNLAALFAAVKPGIVCVEMRGYGFKGAWAERGGFEQHGQSVTGFSANEGAPDSPINPPTYLLNDVMTGVEGTIGMLDPG